MAAGCQAPGVHGPPAVMGTIVAIDGPAGAGKSSVARAVAAQLGFTRLDTGALYRAVTLTVIEQGIVGAEAFGEAARDANLRFEGDRLYDGDRDVTEAIRGREVTARVSEVSATPEVRDALLELQRKLGREAPRGAVIEGRDIGTVVFPDAEKKIFLTASAEARAQRRSAELSAAGRSDTYEDILAAIVARDAYDSSRETAPLRPADGATTVDTTSMSFDEVVQAIVRLVEA